MQTTATLKYYKLQEQNKSADKVQLKQQPN